MAAPSTNIYVCHVNFSNDYQHVVYFNNQDEQRRYFQHRVLKSFYDYSQIRKNWALKVNDTIVNAEKWNYLFFMQGGRTYYYFITNVEYVSDETVKLTLELDVMQSYMWDYALQPCFVEREHSATDEIGDNVIDEGLDVGHLTYQSQNQYHPKKCVMMMTTASLDNYSVPKGMYADGIFSGCYIYRIKLDDMTKVNALFNRLNNDGKIDIILTMWMYPHDLVNVDENENECFELVNDTAFNDPIFQIQPPTKIGEYTPKNNKLLTYPYCYLYATNHSGVYATYRWERFENREAIFRITGCMFPDGGVMFTPSLYNGGFIYDESITVTGFPTCAWVSDTYKIWLAQNQNQLAVNYATAGVSAIAGVATGIAGIVTGNPMAMMSGVGGLAGGLTGIANLLAKQADMEVQPPQARGGTSHSLNASSDLYMTFYGRTVTEERAKIIDDYFTMYGYKTLCVKVPNRRVRERFTYTKTVNCLITGSFPQEDIRKIQSIYDNGVTFWYNTTLIGDYSSSNAVLGGE